jgi:hypothetical protein
MNISRRFDQIMNKYTQVVQNVGDWAKLFLRDDALFYSALIILVAVTSFGLGRWSVAEKSLLTEIVQPTPALVQNSIATTSLIQNKTPPTTSAVVPAVQAAPKYVGSRSGTKYHLLWCPGAKTIKESNKVYFVSKEEAKKAGYQPAANCKGI